jgi:uncharacterized protein
MQLNTIAGRTYNDFIFHNFQDTSWREDLLVVEAGVLQEKVSNFHKSQSSNNNKKCAQKRIKILLLTTGY